MSPDEQEALSRRYSDDIIMLLPLASGSIAVFNSARELCGFIDHNHMMRSPDYPGELWFEIIAVWYAPKPAPTPTKPDVDLNDLELL